MTRRPTPTTTDPARSRTTTRPDRSAAMTSVAAVSRLTGVLFDWAFAVTADSDELLAAIAGLFVEGAVADASEVAAEFAVTAEFDGTHTLRRDDRVVGSWRNADECALGVVSTVELQAA